MAGHRSVAEAMTKDKTKRVAEMKALVDIRLDRMEIGSSSRTNDFKPLRFWLDFGRFDIWWDL